MKSLTVLADREFRRYFIGQSASLLGDGIVGVALAFAVLDLTGSPADLGYVLAARSVPLVAGLLIGGVIADRLPRRGVMVAADVARFLGQASMATLLISGNARIWELAALQALHGAASAVFYPATTGLLPSIVPGDRLQQANALRGLAASAGRVAGPAIAGLLVAAASPGWAIGADAATFAVSAAALALLRVPAHRPPPGQAFLRDLRAGWGVFSSHTWIWAGTVISSLTNMFFAAFLVLGPAVSKLALGGPTSWALIQALLGTGTVIGAVTALRIRVPRPIWTAMLALVLCPLPTLGLAVHLTAVAVAGLALLCGAGITLSNALWETALQHNVPREALSRVSAYDWFGGLACQPIGQVAVGPLSAGLGTYPALWLAGIAQLLVALGGLAVPAVWRLPAGSGGQAPAPVSQES